MKRSHLLGLALALEGTLVGLAVGADALLDVPPYWGWPGYRAVAASVVAVFPMLGMLYLSVNGRLPGAESLRRSIDDVLLLFDGANKWDLLVVSILAGTAEEVLFRGVMVGWMTGSLGVAAAIIVSSIVFGLVHAISLVYAVYAMLVGAYFAILFVTTGDIWVPILTHTLYDFLALGWLTAKRAPLAGSPVADSF
ncbi:MAG: lysostaphin resistance A-like protein [Gemmatimonadales bacterium]